MVLQPVDHRPARLVGVEPGAAPRAAPWIALTPIQDRAECARSPRVRDVDPQRALAAGLDDRRRRAPSGSRSRPASRSGWLCGEQLQAVALGLDLLALVEQVGDVAVGHRHRRGELQRDRDAALHVAGARGRAARRSSRRGGQVVVERHGVEVAGDHHPLGAALVGAGDDGVPEALHLEVVQPAQRRLDGVGDLPARCRSPTRC